MNWLERRVRELETVQALPPHEDWVAAMERAEAGEPVDWATLPKADPRKLEELR